MARASPRVNFRVRKKLAKDSSLEVFPSAEKKTHRQGRIVNGDNVGIDQRREPPEAR